MRQLQTAIVAAAVMVLGGCIKVRVERTEKAAKPSVVIARAGGFVMEQQRSGSLASLRGLSVVNDRVVWASGTEGTVLRTIDGGTKWNTSQVAAASTLDLRDIHAFNDKVAVAMATAGRMYRTSNGGSSWMLVYAASDTSVFLDAISFWDAHHGIVMGDPMNGAFLILLTDDGGVTWRELPKQQSPPALAGEAAFAASGTALAVAGTSHAWFGTGGASEARVFRSSDRGRSWSSTTTGMLAGSASAGIFSVAFSDTLNGIVAGGDYRIPAGAARNFARTTDGGRTFAALSPFPPQYVSGVAWQAPPLTLLAAGISGVAFWSPGADRWSVLDTGNWNSLGEGGNYTWVVGPTGRIARIRR